jgi:hypothetical protein
MRKARSLIWLGTLTIVIAAVCTAQAKAATVTAYYDQLLWRADLGAYVSDSLRYSWIFSSPLETGNYTVITFLTGLRVELIYDDPSQPTPNDKSLYTQGDLFGTIDTRVKNVPGGEGWITSWSMPYPVRGFGLNFDNSGGPGVIMEALLDSDWIPPFNGGIPGFYPIPDVVGPFFGIISDTLFSVVRLRAVGDNVQDSFEMYGPASFDAPIPEPSSVILVISGSTALLIRLRRR